MDGGVRRTKDEADKAPCYSSSVERCRKSLPS